MDRFSICARLDAALEKVAFRKMQIRAIYLTPEDHDALDAELNAQQDYVSAHLSYRDYQIRGGEQSRIYGKCGSAVAVPKRISARAA